MRMVYRLSAELLGLREEDDAADAADIQVVINDRNKRRRRVAISIAVLLLCGTISPFAYAALKPPQIQRRCHYVQLKWENAPEIPPNSWHACRDVVVP